MGESLAIELEGGATSFRPGQAIRGVASWSAVDSIESVRVCLVWFTEGRGTRDIGMAQEVRLISSRTSDRQAFELTAPVEGPFSFSGRLISLTWAVELLIEPGSRSTRQNIVISPSGTEIDLYAGATDASA